MTGADGDLGATLRAWRERLAPEEVGASPSRSRRVRGLRREEVASLAGISVDYLVRLEQGRVTAPSAQVVSALARALQVTRSERDHLYRLAGLREPGDGMIADHVPPGLQRVLARMADLPVAVFAADWRLLWWNVGWAALLGDPSAWKPEERNLVRTRFPVAADGGSAPVRPVRPVRSDDQDASDRALVADLRHAAVKYPNDARLTELVRTRVDGSPRFAQLWNEGAVGSHTEDRKIVTHPLVGDLSVDCDVLVDPGTDLKVVVYTAPPGSEDASKLDLVRVSGVTGTR